MTPLIWLLASASSYAQNLGYSAEIELIRPRYGAGGIPGVQAPITDGPMQVRFGVSVQYERDPLTLYDAISNLEQGAVVTNRTQTDFGLSLDLSDRVVFDAVLPMAASWGSEIANLAADGVGQGDFSVGTKLIGLRSRTVNAGIRGQILLPTSRPGYWVGEHGIRAAGGLIASLDVGPARLATDAMVMGRQRLTTAEDFTLGSEIQWNSGVRVGLPAATRTAFTGTLVSRVGLADFLTGGAENVLEALGGVQVIPSRQVTLDLGAGRGVTEGYGTTDFRVLSQITVRPTEKRPQIVEGPISPPPWKTEKEEPEIIPVLEDRPDDPPVVEVGPVHIRTEPIDFIVNTAILKEHSLPTMAALADALFDDPEIAQIVIEGHASQEGSYGANYDLSMRRAHTIWKTLVELGVDPNRLALRPMGEVEPITEGTDEAALSQNRRVEFHIVQRYEADAIPKPPMPPIPWSGDRQPED